MFSFQSTCVNKAEFIIPETNYLAANGNTSFSEKIFNLAVTKTETVVCIYITI